MTIYTCSHCGKPWTAKKKRGQPRLCPHCHSPRWRGEATYHDLPVEKREPGPGEVKCRQCGNIWRKRTHEPVECPRCHRRNWREEPEEPLAAVG